MEWAPCRRRRAVLIFVISSRRSGDTFVYCQNHRETLRRSYGKTTKKHKHGNVVQKRRDIMQPVFLAHRSLRTYSRVIILYSDKCWHVGGERAGGGKGMTHNNKICQIINRMWRKCQVSIAKQDGFDSAILNQGPRAASNYQGFNSDLKTQEQVPRSS